MCGGHGSDVEGEDPFDWETRDSSMPFWQHAVAGSCAGIVEHVSMYPIDTIKTHMQASPTSMSVSEATRQVLQRQGLRGMMRGAAVIGAGCVPAHAGFFGSYELAVEKFGGEEDANRALRMAGCGGLATIVHDAVLTPHDVIKQHLQLGRHSGAVDAAWSLWRQAGITGFYRSLPVALAMNIPFTGILVACNDSLRRTFKVDEMMRGPGGFVAAAPWHFMCAGISGGIAGGLTTPLDVVKTRVQTQETTTRGATSSILQCCTSIIRQQGLRGLFRGALPRVMLSTPSAAVSWSAYETIRGYLSELCSDSAAFLAEEETPVLEIPRLLRQ
mmetsp:Transcript_89453/g.186891  ORF Transcript_89453/g.186891 Transcript_89453/m.186891 type:complete len:329 (+) Transcript_89453:102-1088(+)